MSASSWYKWHTHVKTKYEKVVYYNYDSEKKQNHLDIY